MKGKGQRHHPPKRPQGPPPFLFGDVSVASRWGFLARNKLRELSRAMPAVSHFEWRPHPDVTIFFHRIADWWRIYIQAKSVGIGDFLVHAATFDDPKGENFTNDRQVFTLSAGAWTVSDVNPIEAGNNYWRSPQGEILSWWGHGNTYFPWMQGNPTLQDGRTISNPAETTSYLQCTIFTGPTYPPPWNRRFGENAYLNGTRIATTVIGSVNLGVAGWSIIDDGTDRWLIALLLRGTVVVPTHYEVRIAKMENLPITSDAEWASLGLMAINPEPLAAGSSKAEWMGPYANFQPWRFTSDGRTGVTLMWDSTVPDAFRVTVSITGTGGAPSQGGNMAATFTTLESATVDEPQQWVYDRSTITGVEEVELSKDIDGSPPGIVHWRHNGPHNKATMADSQAEVFTFAESVIAYDWDKNDNLVTLSWRYERTDMDRDYDATSPYRVVTLTNGAPFGSSTVGFVTPIDAPPEYTAPPSATTLANDTEYTKVFEGYRKIRQIYKLNGNVIYDKSWSASDDSDNGTKIYGGDEQDDTTDPVLADITFNKSFGSPAPGQASAEYAWPVRCDLNKGFVGILERRDNGWSITGQSVGTTPGSVSQAKSPSDVTFTLRAIFAGGGGINLAVGSRQAETFSADPGFTAGQRSNIRWEHPNDSVIWHESPNFGVQPQVGDVTVNEDTRASPSQLTGGRYWSTKYPMPLSETDFDFQRNFPDGFSIEFGGWYQLQCDIAENNGNYFLTCEGPDTADNVAKIVGLAPADPEPIIDTIIDPDIGADPTLRFFPVIPLTGNG